MISQLFAIFIHRAIRYFTHERSARLAVAGAFGVLGLAVGVGLYFFFRAGFRFLAQDEYQYFHFAVPALLYELFLAIIWYLVFLSSLITIGTAMSVRAHDTWIMASPRHRMLPWLQATRTFAVALWPLALIAIPLLAAMRSVFGISAAGSIIAFISLVMLVGATVCGVAFMLIGAGKILVFVSQVRRGRLRLRRWFGAVMLVLGIAVSLFTWYSLAFPGIEALIRIDTQRVTAQVEEVAYHFAYTPSHIAARIFLAVHLGEDTVAGALAGALLLVTLGVAGLYMISAQWHLALWQRLQEGSHRAHVRSSKSVEIGFPHFSRHQIGVVGEKEFLVMVRNPRNIWWLGFLLSLWLIQIVLNGVLTRMVIRQGAADAQFPPLLSALQLLVAVYFVSALALRFAFPSFSTERSSAWIIGSAPIPLAGLFWAKTLFFCGVFFFFGLTAALLNMNILPWTIGGAALYLLLVGTAAPLITFFSLWLGARYPNFDTDDPQALGTSLPGIAFVFISLIYGALGAGALYLYYEMGALVPVLVFLLLSLAYAGWMAGGVPKIIGRFEFTSIRE